MKFFKLYLKNLMEVLLIILGLGLFCESLELSLTHLGEQWTVGIFFGLFILVGTAFGTLADLGEQNAD